jgi:lysophospholipase L1-like esterase
VVVGDSFTFGPNMQLVDTFPKKLEQLLNLNKGAPRVEVLNRGVCGASTVVEVENVRDALREQPDLLVLEITLNDAEPRVLSKQEREELFESRWLKWKIFTVWRSLGFIAARFHNSQTVSRYIDYHSKFFKDPKTYEQFDVAIRRIVTQAKEANVPMVAMVFPLFDFPVNAKYPFAETHEIIARTLTAHGIGVVDLRRAFAEIPPERLQVIPGGDNHPNEIAHRIAAERLLAVIAERGLVPQAALPQRVFRVRTGMKSPSENPARTFEKFANTVDSGLDRSQIDGANSEPQE